MTCIGLIIDKYVHLRPYNHELTCLDIIQLNEYTNSIGAHCHIYIIILKVTSLIIVCGMQIFCLSSLSLYYNVLFMDSIISLCCIISLCISCNNIIFVFQKQCRSLRQSGGSIRVSSKDFVAPKLKISKHDKAV